MSAGRGKAEGGKRRGRHKGKGCCCCLLQSKEENPQREHLHDVVRVALEDLRAVPALHAQPREARTGASVRCRGVNGNAAEGRGSQAAVSRRERGFPLPSVHPSHLVPVPELDEHVVRGGQEVGEDGVDGQAADVIRVRLKGLHAVHGVVVVDADEHVVRAADDPLLARHKLGRTDCGATGRDGAGQSPSTGAMMTGQQTGGSCGSKGQRRQRRGGGGGVIQAAHLEAR